MLATTLYSHPFTKVKMESLRIAQFVQDHLPGKETNGTLQKLTATVNTFGQRHLFIHPNDMTPSLVIFYKARLNYGIFIHINFFYYIEISTSKLQVQSQNVRDQTVCYLNLYDQGRGLSPNAMFRGRGRQCGLAPGGGSSDKKNKVFKVGQRHS